jgi:hypothetical protein
VCHSGGHRATLLSDAGAANDDGSRLSAAA